MPEPFLGEVRLMSFGFPPKGWAFCNGQLLPINQNQALFALFGTMYGGNGQTTFALPNMQDRMPVHAGAGFTQGQVGGEANHTLTVKELPPHLHFLQGTSTVADGIVPTNALLGVNQVDDIYSSTLTTPVALNAAEIGGTGGSQAHNNLQPFLTLNFCVALQGIFPSRT